MKFYDISLPLREGMVVWPGDTRFAHREKKTSAITSRLEVSSHHGTHIDAPRHFLFNHSTVDKIALSKFIGLAKVIEIKFSPPGPPKAEGEKEREGGERSLIKPRDFAHVKIKPHDKIFFKTRNEKLISKKKFDANYVSLSLEAAKFFAKKKIDLVAIDYYGIEAKSAPGHPVHKTLMRAGIVIVEGVDLRKVKPGNYNLAVLPLRVVGGDAAPARAVLWK